MAPPQPPPAEIPHEPDSPGADAVARDGAAKDEAAMLYCPVCSLKLDSRKCKLFCARCGYYMSCADYY